MNDFLAWDNYAQATKTAAEKRAEKAALTRKEKRELAARENQQRLDESDELSKSYRHHRKKDLEKLLEDPAFGLRCQDLVKFLRRMTIADSAELLRRVSEPWLIHAPNWVRFEVLRRVSHHIIRVRRANMLPDIDDGVPWLGEKETLFSRVKGALDVDNPHR